MSGTGLRRAGTGRCYLPGGAAWWGASPSLTRTFFGGGRVGQWWCGGLRTPRGWYVTMSAKACPLLHGCVGGQVLQYVAGSSGISLEVWSCDGSFSLGVHRPRWYPSFTRVLAVLVMLYVWYYSRCIIVDIRRCTNERDDLVLLIECMLIWILIYFMIWFCLLNAQIGKLLLLWMLKLESTMQGVCIWLVDSL